MAKAPAHSFNVLVWCCVMEFRLGRSRHGGQKPPWSRAAKPGERFPRLTRIYLDARGDIVIMNGCGRNGAELRGSRANVAMMTWLRGPPGQDDDQTLGQPDQSCGKKTLSIQTYACSNLIGFVCVDLMVFDDSLTYWPR
jgi:hypothetical protein